MATKTPPRLPIDPPTEAERTLLDAALVIANYYRIGASPRLDLPLPKALIAAAEAVAAERGVPDLADLVETLVAKFPGSHAVRPIKLHPSGPVKGPPVKPYNPNKFALADDDENSFYKFKKEG
jgi:hypothetical protein